MKYRTLDQCVNDLQKNGHLVRIEEEVDPFLEMAAIQRRIYAAQGPAVFFNKVKGSPFPAVSNLFGTTDRTHFIFRDTLDKVSSVIAVKADPTTLLKNPFKGISTGWSAFRGLPKKHQSGLSGFRNTSLSALPQIVSWPDDGGAFITLPQVFSLPPETSSVMQANVGMYRIQISGNQYLPDAEAGMHYQIHRGIGVHHAAHLKHNTTFKVSIFVGGPPAHTLAAVMPLPEGLSELTFAGMLAGHRFRYAIQDGHVISTDADFCITGIIERDTRKPEGPFGDHLGYYSLQHDFPVLKITSVLHRKGAIWPFTVVGRPPQEDTSFGQLIHELAGPLLSYEFPGIHEVHAVDAAGVHPLLLALGSERYMPFRTRQPEEILTQANHLLGKGQTTLAKYLFIAAEGDQAGLTTHNPEAFIAHVLRTFDPRRDLHFQTCTTIDTLDYSGTGLNAGSKLVIAACGDVRRQLSTAYTPGRTPPWVTDVQVVSPGILAVGTTPFSDHQETERMVSQLGMSLSPEVRNGFPLLVLVDDAAFTAAQYNNFLWVTFTRSNPSHDVYGIDASTVFKHWGCSGPLVIDARIKPQHAPVLEEDPEVSRRIGRFFQRDAVLGKWG